MNLQQLIESAQLDVLGLLDDAEREAFEAAFASASPGVQAQVRREQARAARAESLLVEVEPPDGLRDRVIEAVDRAHRVESAVAHAAGREAPVLPPVRRVSRIWRAAALGFATAATVLGVLVVQLTAQYESLQRRLASDALVGQMVAAYGSEYVYDTLFDTDTQRVVFSPAAAGFEGRAALLVNPEWEHAKLFCNALPARLTDGPDEGQYFLAVVDDQGKVVKVLSSFDSQGTLMAQDIELAGGTIPPLAILRGGPDGPSGAPVLAATR